MKKELEKVLIDIAKLVIGGVILAGLMMQDIPPIFLFASGSSVSILLIIAGLVLLSWEEKNYGTGLFFYRIGRYSAWYTHLLTCSHAQGKAS